MKIITMIHTVFPIVESLSNLFKENTGEDSLKLYNIVDDSILPGIQEEGKVSNKIVRSVYNHIISAEYYGSDGVLITCSSISDVVDMVRPFVSIPVIKIDDAMTDEAVKMEGKIGVAATIKTTLNPTISQLEKKADKFNKNIEIEPCLCSDAYEALINENNPEKHDKLLYETLKDIEAHVDSIVLAQASMARLVPKLNRNINKPVLSSPESGVKRALEVIKD